MTSEGALLEAVAKGQPDSGVTNGSEYKNTAWLKGVVKSSVKMRMSGKVEKS